jgi:GNAT superfamily N-acetyltransferase
MRASRMVVMPEWQGAGVGMRFLNEVCQMQIDGKSKYGKRPRCVFFHTSHPGLCSALRRDKKWVQVSGATSGVNKANSRRSMLASKQTGAGYGGHFRAVQGFKYVGSKP